MSYRTLLCITVYNGRSFVPVTLESAARVASDDVDVLVLDDCSPDPGWSEELAEHCARLGFRYYRSPRNLGIPRNVNLGMRAAVEGGYDYFLISNSDVIYPAGVVDGLIAVAQHEGVGSVTAWSNNVSAYSLPNAAPDELLADQGVVDWVDAVLRGQFGSAAMDVPAAISFCCLIPTAVVRDVGLMDPVFGRGYCEETDWSLRSRAAGYRVVLAPGVFVYHAGGGSNRDAGLIGVGETTVPANEAIIDLRYPQFRSQVEGFLSSGILTDAHQDAINRIITDGGRQFGYVVEYSWLPGPPENDRLEGGVVAGVVPDGREGVRFRFLGFEGDHPLHSGDLEAVLTERFGGPPRAINVHDRGKTADEVRFGLPTAAVRDSYAYPTKV